MSPACARLRASLLLSVFAATICFVSFWPAPSGSLGADRPEPRRPHFTDIAPKSNFAYRTDNNFTGRKYFPQAMCGGVAAFDFDKDGRMDLYFTNGAKLPDLEKTDARFYHCLLRNRGDGSFEDVTQSAGLAVDSYGMGCAVGDYDGDGRPDLIVRTYVGYISVWRNTMPPTTPTPNTYSQPCVKSNKCECTSEDTTFSTTTTVPTQAVHPAAQNRR